MGKPALFLTLCFTIKHGAYFWFEIYIIYCIKVVSIYFYFRKCYYQKWILNLIKCLWAPTETSICFYILWPVYSSQVLGSKQYKLLSANLNRREFIGRIDIKQLTELSEELQNQTWETKEASTQSAPCTRKFCLKHRTCHCWHRWWS